MQKTSRIAVLFVAITCCVTIDVAGQQIQPVFKSSLNTEYSLEGPVNQYIQAVTDNWLLRAPQDNPAMLKMFEDRDRQPYRDLLPWSGEFAGKYLTCVAQTLHLTNDQRLLDSGSAFVAEFVALQATAG